MLFVRISRWVQKRFLDHYDLLDNRWQRLLRVTLLQMEVNAFWRAERRQMQLETRLGDSGAPRSQPRGGKHYPEILEAQDELNEYRQGSFLARARALGVWTPPYPSDPSGESGNEWWERGQFGRWELTDEGRRATRSAARKEEDYRAQKFDARIKRFSLIGTVLIGLVGAVTGLVSVLKR